MPRLWSRPLGPVVLLVLSLILAACGGSVADPDDDLAEGLVPVGTEAWITEEAVAADPGATAADPADTADPTAQLPLVPPTTTDPAATAPTAPPVPDQPAAPVDAATGNIDAIIASMTVEQKVGQLFAVALIGNHATEPSDAARRSNESLFGVGTPAEVVARYHLGGVAYLDHDLGPGTSNVADVPQVAVLSAGLQQAAAADTGIGLLIGADQEGGRVVRLQSPATVFPSARAIGDTGQLELARQVGAVTGTEALAVGINWVFAPVADVNVNPDNPVIGDRAFGVESGRVTEFVRATTQGLAEAGVLPTLKHFPGHGDTTIDSHNSLPTIDHDLDTLRAVDLPPFQLAAQDPVRTSVMLGHLAVPAIDAEELPATLSSAAMNLLRGEVGFNGIAVTDAMNMGALSGFGDAGSLAVQSIAAGMDIVLMPTDLPVAYNAVLAAVANGTIPEGRLDVSLRRILATKQALGLLDASAVVIPGPGVLGAPDHQAVREQVRAACGC